MKHFFVIFLVLAVLCTAFGNPTDDVNNSIVLLRQRRQLDIYGSTRKLIEDLVANLRKAAEEARDAIGTFTAGVQEEAKQIREKIANDIQRLRERVAKAIENITNKFIDSGVAVAGCVATHRDNATALFNETTGKAMNCIDERVAEVNEQIQGLSALANGAIEFGNKALDDVRKCTEELNGSILSTGSCLGSVAVQTEMKAVVFATESALTMGRISLSLATLTASLEVCAGSRLVESGISTAKIIMEIGSCSASSVYTTFTGRPLENTVTTAAILPSAEPRLFQ